MSILAGRRKTLYEANYKPPTGEYLKPTVNQYKKSTMFLQTQLTKRLAYFQAKNTVTSRQRFQSSYVASRDNKQNKQQKTVLKEKEAAQCHPVKRFIHNNQSVSDQQLKKFSSYLYKGVKYSVNLKQPSSQYIQKRKLSLLDISLGNQEFDLKKKLLILDLDETLIHSVNDKEQSEISFKANRGSFKFNIRPYCYRFLQDMSKHFNIIVYTASTQPYAQPIVQYLNKPKTTIKGILSRNHCLQTHNGFHIKDLRIIKEYELKDMIIIDNLVHSFAFQLQNGIPILQFLDNKKDRQLYYITQRLISLSTVADVRDEIKKMYRLKSVTQLDEHKFIWKNE